MSKCMAYPFSSLPKTGEVRHDRGAGDEMSTHRFDRRFTNLGKNHFDRFAKIIGRLGIVEGFAEDLNLGRFTKQLIGTHVVLSRERLAVQAVPRRPVVLMHLGL